MLQPYSTFYIRTIHAAPSFLSNASALTLSSSSSLTLMYHPLLFGNRVSLIMTYYQ